VSCNFYNSAARVAALAIARGAEAAIGFQDEIDDALAERFFGDLYIRWREGGWDLLQAFRQTLLGMGTGIVKMTGTGIVLWSARSLIREDRKGSAAMSQKAQEESKKKQLPVFSGTGDGRPKVTLVKVGRASESICGLAPR
jgi:hypothetical protein